MMMVMMLGSDMFSMTLVFYVGVKPDKNKSFKHISSKYTDLFV